MFTCSQETKHRCVVATFIHKPIPGGQAGVSFIPSTGFTIVSDLSYAFPMSGPQNRTEQLTFKVRALKGITSSSNFHFVFNLQIWGSHSQNSLLGSIKSTLDLFPLGGLAPTSDYYFVAALVSDSPGFPVLVPILDSWP